MARRRDKGQGGITHRADGRWQGTYQDGQDRKRYVYGKTKREAQEQLVERQSQVRQGISLEPGRETVATFMTRWLRDVKAHDVERGTHAFYTEKAALITPMLGKTLLRSLTAQQVQELYSSLLADDYSATTVRHVHTTIKAMLGQALKWNLVAKNVARDAKPPKARKFQPTVLAADEVRTLLEVNRAHRLYPAVAVAVTTGLRLGELRALKWDSVDTERAELKVTQTIDDIRGGGWVLKVPKSERGRRAVALGATALSALIGQRQRQRLERMAAGPRWKDHGLVFTTLVGTPLQERRTLTILQEMERRAGVPVTRFHDLRHTHATILLLSGVPVHVVAARLGDDPATVLRSYAHLLPQSQAEAAAKFDEVIGL